MAAGGVRLDPAATRFQPNESTGWEFQILDVRNDPVTEVQQSHGQQAHVIVVRRDLIDFQHLHPSLEPDGTWHVDGFALPKPGVYRVFVDVVVDDRPTTLGLDLFAPGSVTPAPRPATDRRDSDAGYEIVLETDEITSGEPVSVAFTISRDGDPVSDLQPYLGASGHLVALREGDLAYLHVHPEETDPASGRVEFGVTIPTPGRHRLFLQSKPDGTLVTTRHDVRVES